MDEEAIPVTVSWDDTYTESKKRISSILKSMPRTPETHRAVQTVGYYLHNLLQDPSDPKFSTINTLNKGYLERVASVPEAERILLESEFVRHDNFLKRELTEGKEAVLVLQEFLEGVLLQMQTFLNPTAPPPISAEPELPEIEENVLGSTKDIYLEQLQQVKIDMLLQKLQPPITNAIGSYTTEDTAVGTLLVGDILGTQVQDWSEDLIKSKFGELLTVYPKAEKDSNKYSDLIAFSIALATSMTTLQYLDLKHISNCYADISDSIQDLNLKSALRYKRNDDSYADPLLREGDRSNILAVIGFPVSIAFRNASDVSLLNAVKTALYPFRHDEEEGAFLLCIALKELSLLDDPFGFKPKEFVTAITNSAQIPVSRTKLLTLQVLLEKLRGPNKNTVDSKFLKFLSSSLQVTSIDAVMSALWFFLRYFKDPVVCLSRSVTCGGDAGVVGALVGALLGALHGTSWIPQPWFEGIENGIRGRDKAISLGKELATLCFQGYTLPAEIQRKR